jgi:hypothetical protein
VNPKAFLRAALPAFLPSQAPSLSARLFGVIGVIGLFGLTGLSGCIQGGGTDVGNALVEGRVMDGGAGVASAKVMLMPEGYNPVLGDSTGRARVVVAGADGKFSIEGVVPGRYSLESRHPSADRMDFIGVLDVEAGETRNAIAVLDAARNIIIRIPAASASDAYVFIPGSDVKAVRAPEDTAGILHMLHAPREAIPVLGTSRLSDPYSVSWMTVNSGAEDTLITIVFP